MSISRRNFLKLAGISSLLAAGGTASAYTLWKGGLEPSQARTNPEGLQAERWAMVVDVKKFKSDEDYRRVIDACHSIHNVPDLGNPKDEIKWIWTEEFEHAFPGQQNEYIPETIKHMPFTLLCNHCDNPPCVRVCPTKATFRREADGVVMMDQHRCIGCRFCMAACPYGARSFNYRDPRGKDENGTPFIKKINPEFPTRTIGVVEKCTFCAERLAVGKRPACVEKSNGALVFGDLKDPRSEVRELLRTHYTIRRKPELGTQPSVYYIIGGVDHA